MNTIFELQFLFQIEKPELEVINFFEDKFEFSFESLNYPKKNSDILMQILSRDDGYRQSFYFYENIKKSFVYSRAEIALNLSKRFDVNVLMDMFTEDDNWLLTTPDGNQKIVPICYTEDSIDVDWEKLKESEAS